MNIKQTDTESTIPSCNNFTQNQHFSSQCSSLNHIKVITDTIEELDFKLQSLRQNSLRLTTKEIKEYLYNLPDLQSLLSEIRQIFQLQQRQSSSTKLIYQIPTEIQVVDEIASPSFYEVPVEMMPLQNQTNIYEVPVEMSLILDQDSVAQYFAEFQSYDMLPDKIKKIVCQFNNQKQIKTNFYQIPVEMKIEVQTTEVEMQTQCQEFPNITELSIHQEGQWDEVDDTLQKMQKLMKSLSMEKKQNTFEIFEQNIENIQFTGTINEDLKMVQDQFKERQIYEIPVEMQPFTEEKELTDTEVQCEEEEVKPLYEIPIQMEMYKPECSLCSNVTEIKIDSKPKDIHLSSSVESFFYENKNQIDTNEKFNPITPISNIATGWEHPELDFCNSSQIASRSNDKDLDSFANSQIILAHKDSINYKDFKESCIKKKSSEDKNEENSIVETLNIKTNNPIYVIASESSSEGSETDRQMYISEMKDINEIKNIKIQDDKFKEEKEDNERQIQLQDMKVKCVILEQEKNDLAQQLKLYESQVFTLREEISVQKETLLFIKSQNLQQENDFRTVRQTAQKLESSTIKKQQQIIQLCEENTKLKSQIEAITERAKEQEEFIEKMNGSFAQIQNEFFKEIEKMNLQINEKDNVMKEMADELEQNVTEHMNEVNELERMNEQLRMLVDELTKQVYEKKVNIQELKYNYDALMNKIESACSDKNELNEIKSLYSKEYEKMKEDFDIILAEKDKQIFALNLQNKNLVSDSKQKGQNIESTNMALEQHQKVIDDLRQELQTHQRQLKDNKFSIASHVEAQLDYLRRELVFLTKQVDLRDLKIKQLNLQIKQNTSHQNSKLSIDFCEGEHVEELKQIIKEYENIIVSNQNSIRQLQEYVFQYLGDALEKEVEVENLYENLLNFQTDIHELTLQKIAVDKENKKLKRVISKSERKISAIGNRLIVVAKDKLQEEDSIIFEKGCDKKYKNEKSQNSTIKMGTQSNLIH